MEILELKEENVQLIDGAMALPQIIAFKNKVRNAGFVERSLRYIFYMYSRKSVFRDLPPAKRKKKIFDTFFVDERDDYFSKSEPFKKFADWYYDFTKSYKEKMYENHLKDIEEMAINISKISFKKTKRIIRVIDVKVGKEWVKADVDVEIEIDNTQEKLNAMDLMTRLLEKEEFLKKKIDEEYIKKSAKQQDRRLFDKQEKIQV